MEQKQRKIIFITAFLVSCMAMSLTTVQAQWLSPEDFRTGKRILAIHELADESIFGHVPDIDTTLLNRTRAHYDTEKEITERLTRNVMEPLPLKQFMTANAPDSLSSTEREAFLKKRGDANMMLSNAISAKLAASRDILRFPSRYRFLEPFKQPLKNILYQIVFQDSISGDLNFCELYALLDPEDSVKQKLLSMPLLSTRAKSLLGHEGAEQTIINNFWNLIRDSVDVDMEAFDKASQELLVISSKNTLDAYFEALTSSRNLYQSLDKIDSKQLYKASAVPFLLLINYGKLHYSELYYFEKYIYYNQALSNSMWPIVYYSCVGKYLSNKYRRKISIRAFFDVRIVDLSGK